MFFQTPLKSLTSTLTRRRPTRRPHAARRRPACRLVVEELEGRTLLSVAYTAVDGGGPSNC